MFSYKMMIAKSLELLFSHKPCGLGWLFKALCVPFLRLFSPPELPTRYIKRHGFVKKFLSQLSVLSPQPSSGGSLSTLMIDFFDEGRVKKALDCLEVM